MSDKYRIETADSAPGLATIVNNETGQSILGTLDQTPVFAERRLADLVLALLNSGMIDERI